MLHARRAVFPLLTRAAVVVAFGFTPNAQTQYPKPTDLPNPYRLVQGWPTIPQRMNGGRWGEVIRVHVARDGNIWVFHRCFNTVPPGSAVCINRGPANPPILEFDPAGRLLRSFGAGLFAYPHGFTVDQQGNLWATDVNDAEVVLGMSARNAAGVVMGQEVLKLSPNGRVLMTLGKEGVSGNGPDTFDRPTGVAIAPNGDIFVTDGHLPNAHNTGRVMKFSKDGKFIKSWGKMRIRARRFRRTARHLPRRLAKPHLCRRSPEPAHPGLRSGRQLHRRVEAIRGAELGVRGQGRQHLCGLWILRSGSQARRDQGHRGRQRLGRIAEGVHSRSGGPGQLDPRDNVVRHCGG